MKSRTPNSPVESAALRVLKKNGVPPESAEGQNILNRAQKLDAAIHRTSKRVQNQSRPSGLLRLLYNAGLHEKPVQFSRIPTRLRNVLKTRESQYKAEHGSRPFDKPLIEMRTPVTWEIVDRLLTPGEREWHAVHGPKPVIENAMPSVATALAGLPKPKSSTLSVRP